MCACADSAVACQCDRMLPSVRRGLVLAASAANEWWIEGFRRSAASFGSVAKDATCLRVVLTEVTQTDDFAALEHLQNLQVLELTLPLQPVDGASQTRLLSTVRFPKSLDCSLLGVWC